MNLSVNSFLRIRMSISIFVFLMCGVVLLVVDQVSSEQRNSEDLLDLDLAGASTTYKTIMLDEDQGIRGYENFAETGIMTFLGIPYVLPPTGNRRFNKPEAMPAWKGIKDALDLSPKCLQSDDVTDDESEDCLYLNIFTPDNDGKIPVMVWIHGGGFAFGSGNYWDGTQLSGKGVVMVTLNYRLSALGFAATGDDVMPGNFGMLDQVSALTWVQKHIHAFGGDAGQVTVFGNSAGSTSISLHLLSPLSAGLFHRAIMESGSSFSLWGVEMKKDLTSIKEATMEIAGALGCPMGQNSSVVLDYMRKVDGHSIVKQAIQLQKETDTLFIFLPRVETAFGFLPKDPNDLFQAGNYHNVETMSGFTSGEAAGVIYGKFPEAEGISRSQFKEGLLEVFTWCSFAGEDEIVEHIAEYYLKNVTDPKAILSRLYEAADDLYNMPVLIQLNKFLKHQSAPKTQRLYQFDYLPRTVKVPKKRGLEHGLERTFVFYSATNTILFTHDDILMDLSPEDIRMADTVQTMWTNFAKFGDPLISSSSSSSSSSKSAASEASQWPGYTSDTPLLAHIDFTMRLSRYTKQPEVDLYWDFLEYVNSDHGGSLSLNVSMAAIGSVLGLAVTLFYFWLP